MRLSGATGSSRKLPETTDEVFSSARSCKPAAQKITNVLFSGTRVYFVIRSMATPPTSKIPSPDIFLVSWRVFELVNPTLSKNAWTGQLLFH